LRLSVALFGYLLLCRSRIGSRVRRSLACVSYLRVGTLALDEPERDTCERH
jgi:hypothetical protein